MTTPAEMLVRGLGLIYEREKPEPVPTGSLCIVCGGPLTEGYAANRIISEATTEYLDQFRGNPSGMLCRACATCYKNNAPKAGMPTSRTCMAFADGTYWNPLIARGPAGEQGRACWSDLVRAVWPERAGQECLVILTTDQKKRLWPRARVGALGTATPVYLHDGELGASGVFLVNWPRLLGVLDAVETIYTAGFVKVAIRSNLYANSNVVREVGIAQTAEWERSLRGLRGSVEFDMATLIAQRKGEEP